MRTRSLLLCALAMVVGCSPGISNRAAPPGKVLASNPVRWRADPACMQGAPLAPGDSRETLSVYCNGQGRHERDLIALTLSGGGTKAAVFSAESMFYLDALGLLRRTSVLSSVSGGSVTAALYALSCDRDDTTRGEACGSERVRGMRRPVWDRVEVMRKVGQGYWPVAIEQVGRWIVPWPVVREGTISAGSFARHIDQYFFGTSGGRDSRFHFADLNPRRPHLVLNATLLSPNRGGLGGYTPPGSKEEILTCHGAQEGRRGWLRRRNPEEYFHFAYTDVFFNLLRSNLREFPVSGAVAASAAFPVLIDNAELIDYCRPDGDKDGKLRLMDGGVNDNQGMVAVYHILAELVLGQRRSDVLPRHLEKLGNNDTAYIFVINSSITETTGPTGTGTGSGPLGPIPFLFGVLSKTLNSVDVYSATAFNLRKNYYVNESRRVAGSKDEIQAPRYATVRPVEIGLTGLDQYRQGGAQAALWTKSGILNEPEEGERSDQDLKMLQGRVKLHEEVFRRVLPAQARRDLQLSAYHPQCYYDIRERLDASLLSIPADEKACLREAARWSTALVAQEFCEQARQGQRDTKPPDGLDCSKGLVLLQRPGVLDGEGEIGGSCETILKDLIQKQKDERKGAPPAEDACQLLSSQ